MNLENLRVLDLETTGFGSSSEVLEASVIDGLGNTLIHELCGVERNVAWTHAQKIHGIAPEDVAGKPSFAEFLPLIIEMCRDKDVIIYNKGFDLSYCNGLEDVASSVHCCMVRFSNHYGGRPGCKWQKLEKAAAVTGFDWGKLKAHSALSDTLATLHVWKYLEERGALYA